MEVGGRKGKAGASSSPEGTTSPHSSQTQRPKLRAWLPLSQSEGGWVAAVSVWPAKHRRLHFQKKEGRCF